MRSVIFAAKLRKTIMHMSGVIFVYRQLFVGHVVALVPMRKKEISIE